jgi:hypothetical protein
LKKCDKQSSHRNVRVHGTFVPKNFTVTHFTSLKKKSIHINHDSSLHLTTLTSLHLFTLHPHLNSLVFVTTFLTLFLNVFSLQGKDVSKPAGTW